MGNNKDDDGSWPDELFRNMRDGHAKYMRDLRQQDTPSSAPATTDEQHQPPRGLFVIFRDLVDSTATGLNDLARNITQLPSNMTELRTRMQSERQLRRDEEMELWRRWTGHSISSDHVLMMTERATLGQQEEAMGAAMRLVQESARRNEKVSLDKIQALFGEPSRKDPLGLFDMLEFNEAERFLGVEWFKRNTYSPFQLEVHTKAGRRDWRAAFEDLLSATLEKPMRAHDQIGERPNGNPQSTFHGPGLDWMLSLQCRGILPPQLPGFWQQVDVKRRQGGLQEQITMYLLQKTQRSGNGVRQDSQFHDLVREIATPAPETSFQPESAGAMACMLGSSAPETEQDLYDTLYAREQPPEPIASTEQSQRLEERVEQGTRSDVDNYTFPTWSSLTAEQMEELAETLHQLRDEQWRQHVALDQEDSTRRQVELRGDDAASAPTSSTGTSSPIPPPGPSMDDRTLALEQQAEALGLDASVVKEIVDNLPRAQDEVKAKVDVLSSLTTTQTTRLPDGTVTTTVMLKQRFADGRETIDERVHTYQEQRQPLQSADSAGVEGQAAKKGWFWL